MTGRWLLESVQISDIINSKARFNELVQFHWHYYSELAFQRNQIREKLRDSLRGKATSFGSRVGRELSNTNILSICLVQKAVLLIPADDSNVGV